MTMGSAWAMSLHAEYTKDLKLFGLIIYSLHIERSPPKIDCNLRGSGCTLHIKCEHLINNDLLKNIILLYVSVFRTRLLWRQIFSYIQNERRICIFLLRPLYVVLSNLLVTTDFDFYSFFVNYAKCIFIFFRRKVMF